MSKRSFKSSVVITEMKPLGSELVYSQIYNTDEGENNLYVNKAQVFFIIGSNFTFSS